MRFRPAHHALPPPILDDRLGPFGACAVVAIEGTRRDVTIELRAIGCELRLKSVKDFFWKAAGIGRCHDHQRWDCTDYGRLRHTAFTVAGEIVHYLAAAG